MDPKASASKTFRADFFSKFHRTCILGKNRSTNSFGQILNILHKIPAHFSRNHKLNFFITSAYLKETRLWVQSEDFKIIGVQGGNLHTIMRIVT